MNWLSYSLAALLVYSGYDLVSRLVGVKSKNPVAFAGIYSLIVALMAPILLFIEPFQVPHGGGWIIVLTIVSLTVWGLFGRFEYLAHKHVEASALSIIIKLSVVISFVLSTVILKESVTVTKLIGLILILLANVVVFVRPGLIANLRKQEGIIYGFIVALLLGVGWTMDKVVAPHYGVVLFAIISFLSPAFVSLALPPQPISAIKKELQIASWRIIVLALLNVIGYGLMLKALILGNASNVMPIISSTTPIVLVAAALFLGERAQWKTKCLACGLIIIGIYLLR